MKLQMLGNPIALVIPCHSHAARCWLSGEWHRMLHCWPQTSYTGIWHGSDSHICLALPNSYWKLWMLKAHSTPENQAWCICPATPVGCLFIYLFIFLAINRHSNVEHSKERCAEAKLCQRTGQQSQAQRRQSRDDLLVQMHRPSLKSDTMPNISRVNCCNKSICRSPCSCQIYLQTSKFSFVTQSTIWS